MKVVQARSRGVSSTTKSRLRCGDWRGFLQSKTGSWQRESTLILFKENHLLSLDWWQQILHLFLAKCLEKVILSLKKSQTPMLTKQPPSPRLLINSTKWRKSLLELCNNQIMHHLAEKPHPPTWNVNMCPKGREHGVLRSSTKACHGACPCALWRIPPLCRSYGLHRCPLEQAACLHAASTASHLTVPAFPRVRYLWQPVSWCLCFWVVLSPGILVQLHQLLRSCLMLAKKAPASSDASPVPMVSKDQSMLGWGEAPW